MGAVRMKMKASGCREVVDGVPWVVAKREEICREQSRE